MTIFNLHLIALPRRLYAVRGPGAALLQLHVHKVARPSSWCPRQIGRCLYARANRGRTNPPHMMSLYVCLRTACPGTRTFWGLRRWLGYATENFLCDRRFSMTLLGEVHGVWFPMPIMRNKGL